MTGSRRNNPKALVAEMILILVMAAAIGSSWNRKLLLQAWKGEAPEITKEGAGNRGDIPLPLGLMQVKELYERKEGVIVDARDSKSFADGHIAGARSLPLGELEARLPRFIADVPPTATIIAYCNGYGCHDSSELGVRLLRAGYRTVFVFEGGYPEWRDGNYPTEGGSR
jgi:rhodanese-related sulfurtransferase